MITYKIEVKELTDKVTIEGKEYYLIECDKAEKLLSELKQAKEENRVLTAEIKELKHAITQIMLLLGVVDKQTLKIKQELMTGETSYLKVISKSFVALVGRVTAASIINSEKEALEKDFAFIENIIPIINKYAGK